MLMNIYWIVITNSSILVMKWLKANNMSSKSKLTKWNTLSSAHENFTQAVLKNDCQERYILKTTN